MSSQTKPRALRCAIYTRKSSEEGLEQDFNSLHAQRESCEAYIRSQKHEGWSPLVAKYDDGGYSGGSLERPALKRLLTDIQSKSVDVVVVYKVDRLTRSLADFAKIVEIFDASGVSFVSVTQQFNTTTSMGRLTLNVLLSFAQFEREVTGERIRDKIAASKQKGMWMGGWVPIGYDRKDRTLVINEIEAETIRLIFALFLKLKNVQKVKHELGRRNLTTKAYATSSGRTLGSLPFSRGHIYRILSNPLYIGEIEHKSIRHPGQHPSIIDQNTWTAVQNQIGSNRHKRHFRINAKSPNLLAGLMRDERGQKFVSSHTNKKGKRYRYYIEADADDASPSTRRNRLRLPAEELESAVADSIRVFLTDRMRVAKMLRAAGVRPGLLDPALTRAEEMSETLNGMFQERLSLVKGLVAGIKVGAESLSVALSTDRLVQHLIDDPSFSPRSAGNDVAITIPLAATVRNGSRKTVIANRASKILDTSLITAIARGTCWFEELTTGKAPSILSIATREQVTDSYVSRLLPLALLPPSIISGALNGDPIATAAAKSAAAGQEYPSLWQAESI